MSPAPDHRTAPPAHGRPITRRRAARVPVRATGVAGGGAAVGVSAYAGAPWWVFLCSVLCMAMANVARCCPRSPSTGATWCGSCSGTASACTGCGTSGSGLGRRN
ncbi:hypothetical protein GCM10011579_067730 [Streptomyces albiflavescens]|uniref:Uncharacterized protein n=1 Tax=Streptomyces albiflavescens TaxID=1623582 RepID=A0A917YAT6_9ACTN|nr:hypothetical protein GCM10011579_067730 [Streptomyces albiflavescens]